VKDWGDEKKVKGQPGSNGLDSYRRLIKLQKQMIELSERYERSRRECETLRASVVREVAARQSMGTRLRASASKLLQRWPLSVARDLFS
jgi:hypothetical protein